MNNDIPTIKLIDIKSMITTELTNKRTKPLLFIDPKGLLETYFKYKGIVKNVKELSDIIKSQPKTKQNIEIDLLNSFKDSMTVGTWLIFNLGNNPTINCTSFLGQLSFYDKNICRPNRIMDKQYCFEHKILPKEIDVDGFGNEDIFHINEGFKLIFVSSCTADSSFELYSNNKELDPDIVIVE